MSEFDLNELLQNFNLVKTVVRETKSPIRGKTSYPEIINHLLTEMADQQSKADGFAKTLVCIQAFWFFHNVLDAAERISACDFIWILSLKKGRLSNNTFLLFKFHEAGLEANSNLFENAKARMALQPKK